MDDSSDGAFGPSVYLAPERCVVLERAAKEEVLDKLVGLLGNSPEAGDAQALADGIRAREKLLSTGIGL